MRSSYLFYLRCLASLAMLAVIPAVLASDYTLEIFGNANMDDKIDEADVTHIEDIIASSTSPTPLSDVNGDGEVDGSDIDQVQRIINGTVEQLIVMDEANRTVRIDMPVKSVVPLVDRDAKILGVLGATDLVVAVSDNIKDSKEYEATLPSLTDLESVGSWTEPDLEKLLRIEPDLLIAYSNSAENINNSIGNRVAVLGFASSTPHSTKDELLKLSYVLNKRERAERYFKEFHEKEP